MLFCIENEEGKKNTFRHPKVMGILEVLCVSTGWGKSPGNALECSREASEGAPVPLLTRTAWNADVTLRVFSSGKMVSTRL